MCKFLLIQIAMLTLLCGCDVVERLPKREMTVTSGPDLVFERPVSEILPQLENAIATGLNGRVGNEMVFWGYRLSDGRAANMFACAILDDVDCEARIQAICPLADRFELGRDIVPGNVRRLNCRAIGVVAVGDLLPNCSDNESSMDVLVGLMQCL